MGQSGDVPDEGAMLQLYLQDVRGNPHLTVEEERALLPLARAGIPGAERKIIESWLGRAADLALAIAPPTMPRADAIQAANVALIQLVQDKQIAELEVALKQRIRDLFVDPGTNRDERASAASYELRNPETGCGLPGTSERSFWQVFCSVSRLGPGQLQTSPGAPSPPKELQAIVAAAVPGPSSMTTVHCRAFGSEHDAARDILDANYPGADAYVVEAETSMDALRVFCDNAAPQCIWWIGKTTAG